MWQITFDHFARDDEPSRVGYSELHSRIPVMAAVIGLQSELLPGSNDDPDRPDAEPGFPTVPFRLKDDDGEVYYEGWLHDDDECLNQSAALSWGEGDSGCTTIEVKRNEEWKLEIG